MPAIKEQQLKFENLTGKQKIALLLISLDMEASARVFKSLTAEEVEQISIEIANLRGVDQSVTNKVIEEFYSMMVGHESYSQGGLDYARNILIRSFGTERANSILEKIQMLTTVRGFDILRKADAQQLASFLSKEHPQTIALVLSHLPTDQSANVIGEFSDDIRADVLMRIAGIGKVSPAVVQQIEKVVDEIAEQTLSQNMSLAGGAQIVANILNKSTVGTAKSLMEQIEEKDSTLATDIKRLMFLFDDILMIDDRGIQRILRDVDKRDLTLALKGSDDRMRTKIFKNMSERASSVVKEELEFMGPVKLKEVESAQARIVDVVKKLEEKEEISVGGRGKDDAYV